MHDTILKARELAAQAVGVGDPDLAALILNGNADRNDYVINAQAALMVQETGADYTETVAHLRAIRDAEIELEQEQGPHFGQVVQPK